MKKLNVGTLALTFAGCFLGAGYVSGQELWQFFGHYGPYGFIGLILAVIIFAVFGILLLKLSKMTGIQGMDKIIIPWNIRWLRGLVAVMELVFLLSIVMIMSAGVGALINQFFGISPWIGSAVFTVIIALVAMWGIDGMVSSFSICVPILICATVIFGVIALSKFGIEGIYVGKSSGGGSPLLGAWGVSAVVFSCYNIFGSVGILAPLGHGTKSKKTITAGIIIGSLFLLLIAVCVISAIMVYPVSADTELPMLTLAMYLSPAAGYIYGLLLVFAMFGTAVSSLVAVSKYMELTSEKLFKRRKLLIIIIALVCFGGSLVGFGDLIGVLYPVFGYASSVFIVCIAVHYIIAKRNKKFSQNEKNS